MLGRTSWSRVGAHLGRTEATGTAMMFDQDRQMSWRYWWLALVLCLVTACSGSEETATSLANAQEPASRVSEILVEPGTSVGGEKRLELGQPHQITKDVTLYVQDGRILSFQASEEVSKQERAKWSTVLGSRYVVGDIHATDVTPVLWRTLDVELAKDDGSLARIQMLRPLWWLESTGARAGGVVNLSVTEAGLSGEARVLSIKDDVRQDSRKLKPGTALVTGKIRHENASVLEMVVDGDQEHPLGVTPNHPLFSADRQAFVPAGEFKVGDRIRTAKGGTSTVTSVRVGASSVPVYNLEVHRAQHYFVGPQRLIAHNTGIDCDEIASSVKKPPSANDEFIYRGVNANHPKLKQAKEGVVEPGDVRGSVTSSEHNKYGDAGDLQSRSPLTSWSRDPEVAKKHALKAGEGGVVVRARKGAPGPDDTWSWEWSPDHFFESEVLMRGRRDGLEVIDPSSF